MASPNRPAAEVEAELVKFQAQVEGKPEAQARKELELQKRVAEIRAAEPGDDSEIRVKNGQIVVFAKNGVVSNRLKGHLAKEANVKIKPTKRHKRDLDAAAKALIAGKPNVQRIEIDPENERLVAHVTSAPDATTVSLLESTGVPFTVEIGPPTTLTAGQGGAGMGGSPWNTCTTGFSFKETYTSSGPGTKLVSTSGHCPNSLSVQGEAGTFHYEKCWIDTQMHSIASGSVGSLVQGVQIAGSVYSTYGTNYYRWGANIRSEEGLGLRHHREWRLRSTARAWRLLDSLGIRDLFLPPKWRR